MNGAAPLPYSAPVELLASDPARNIHRRYRIELSSDLFGGYIVELSWGRVGTRGQVKRFAFPDRNGAERLIASKLRRRNSAQRRFGVAYRPLEAASADHSNDK